MERERPTSNTQTVVVASKNPVKIDAALKGFNRMFPGSEFKTTGVSVPSGVAEQPFSDSETLQGAINRVHNARDAYPGADYYIGLEGGLNEDGANLQSLAWIAVLGKDGRIGKARTTTFCLPEEVSQLIRQGKELGEADDIVFGRTNSKQHNGAAGLLTGDVVDRSSSYEHAVILALIPFKNPTLTFL
ncbi:Inosine/xanthosine triphosphatase [Paramyrothecium foliicola]|nr:Inosine/xanthosine triphosphatase [Paramyrothecium foliicola]